MERLEGTDMLAGIRKTPRGLMAAGKLLADLHRRLGAIPRTGVDAGCTGTCR